VTSPGVDDLVRALQTEGVLTREELRERSGARYWRTQSFDAALRVGIAAGSIRALGPNLFEAGEDAPDLSAGGFDPT
jgi:hypothetical protein